jgi:hypothetical protein
MLETRRSGWCRGKELREEHLLEKLGMLEGIAWPTLCLEESVRMSRTHVLDGNVLALSKLIATSREQICGSARANHVQGVGSGCDKEQRARSSKLMTSDMRCITKPSHNEDW